MFNQGEVANIAGISRHLVKVSIKNGDLPTRPVGNMRYVTRAALLRFIQRLYGDDEPAFATPIGAERFHQAMREPRKDDPPGGRDR